MKTNDIYLGDGLYASFDGFQFRLWTERTNGTHEVFLDGRTLAAFESFVSVVREGPPPKLDQVDAPDPRIEETDAEAVGQSPMGPPL